MIDLNVFDQPCTVHVDWDYALKVTETLDTTATDDDRRPVTGMAAIRLLAEYGATAHSCAACPDNLKLLVVVSPPIVVFSPSIDGIHGIFVEEYNPDKHGVAGVTFHKEINLLAYTNLAARLDAWDFCAEMLSAFGGN